MGYEDGAARQIQSLAILFQSSAPDRETLSELSDLAGNRAAWSSAHDMFRRVRRLYLDTNDPELLDEYFFIESCLQTLYNETYPPDPFDSISPFYVLQSAIGFAMRMGVTLEEIHAAIRNNPG